MARLHYFAYGSNLYPERLRRRCPTAVALGPLRLPGWRLAFHKRSDVDGSAKCDLVETGALTDAAYGVVYGLDPADKPALDRAEGLGTAYHERRVDTEEYGAVFFYVAEPRGITTGLAPLTWYHRYVLEGARLHGLPEAYLDAIAAVPTQPDLDEARARGHDEAFEVGREG